MAIYSAVPVTAACPALRIMPPSAIMTATPLTFDHPSFDRAALLRRGDAWRTGLTGTVRLLAVRGDLVLVDTLPAPLLASRRLLDVSSIIPDSVEGLVYLGRDAEGDWLSVDLDQHPSMAAAWIGAEPTELRTIGMMVAADQAGLAAYARALAWFHRTHRFCSRCGAPTAALEAGHSRRCTNAACGNQVYPRSDPAIIVLVHRGEQCLLARSPRFAEGMLSTLAGFVEAGESIEACVVREVAEEVGVRVVNPVYMASQPWPLPQSLMLGFFAEATTTHITVDPEEIESAQWIDRKTVRAVLAGAEDQGFRLPNRISISHWLIRRWAEG
jgi:NAD+ diphosphatase